MLNLHTLCFEQENSLTSNLLFLFRYPPQLTNVSLEYCYKISDVTNLSACSNLKRLSLQGENQNYNLDSLTQLIHLDPSWDHIFNEGMVNMTNLTSLILHEYDNEQIDSTHFPPNLSDLTLVDYEHNYDLSEKF